MAAIDWSQCPDVESLPQKVSGAWVIRGSRMPVETILENLEDGMTIDQIVHLYDGLTREQIHPVLLFVARHRKEQEFVEVVGAFRDATDPEEVRRLGDRLGRMLFG